MHCGSCWHQIWWRRKNARNIEDEISGFAASTRKHCNVGELRMFRHITIWILSSLSVQTFLSTTLPWGGSTTTNCLLWWPPHKNGKNRVDEQALYRAKVSSGLGLIVFDLWCRPRDRLWLLTSDCKVTDHLIYPLVKYLTIINLQ